MRPKKLTLSAWGPYKSEVTVDFTVFEQKGIFLITGATGAGKTTIFDAISYALYGALSGEERDKERNSVRSDFADAATPTYVELLMEHGGALYHIKRNPEYLRPSKRGGGKLFTKEKENAILTYPDGKVIEGSKDVNAALQDLLALDYQQFKKISMIAQGEFARMLVASPKDKTKIFREIFGTGIYEKFTQGLGARSRSLYVKVMEQKHKLEEDIRILGADLEKGMWDSQTKEEFQNLLATDNWNYEVLADCLAKMKEEATEGAESAKKKYEKQNKAVEKQTAELTKQENVNAQIDKLEQVRKELEQLKQDAPSYREKEVQLKQAKNAGWVEVAEEKNRHQQQLLMSNGEQQQQLSRSCEVSRKALQDLKQIVECADDIRLAIEQNKLLNELESEAKCLGEQLEDVRERLVKEQQNYLKQEALCAEQKRLVEEGERARRHAAIGLAASLLVEGSPCPVCGSLSHPTPAKVEEGVMSEDELKHHKAELDKATNRLQQLHGESVATKTQCDGLVEQQKEKQECIQEVKVKLEEIRAKLHGKQDNQLKQANWVMTIGEVLDSYLTLPYNNAINRLQTELDKSSKLQGLLGEQEKQLASYQEMAKDLEKQAQESRQEYELLLKEYGFKKEEEYLQAKLSREQQDALQQQIENYQNKLSANEEFLKHLKDTVKKAERVDIQELKDQIVQVKYQRDAVLKEQKLWEQHLTDVKKTIRMMKEKQTDIESVSNEYGYVKDLENMANGNNAKKLVFEQYVLAGYFEEILRAANIRFRKMTSNRYEMSRVEEVGDGRVKDNLEIQVFDYYTGKNRSVRTLSGGESFKASLSLALGMSDVIQSMSGGIKVDTLFVDEGFGALDSESLEQACDALMSLVENNRLIGIISHVPQLQERIGQQLIIDKTGSGSLIRNSVY